MGGEDTGPGEEAVSCDRSGGGAASDDGGELRPEGGVGRSVDGFAWLVHGLFFYSTNRDGHKTA